MEMLTEQQKQSHAEFVKSNTFQSALTSTLEAMSKLFLQEIKNLEQRVKVLEAERGLHRTVSRGAESNTTIGRR